MENSEMVAREAEEKKSTRPAYFVRFSLGQRIEHLVLLVSFTLLVITGLSQRFYEGRWAYWIIQHLGGIDNTRTIHRIFALVMTTGFVYHLGYVSYGVLFRRVRASMVPTLQDARDAINTVRYSLGFKAELPRFDRYEYRQKFEYWGIIFGSLIIIGTGFILAFPITFTRFLPGEVVPAAKEFHRNEALLALLTIAIWHMYSAHLRPGVFPLDTTIFTGRISRHRMEEEHPLEMERAMATEEKEEDEGAGRAKGESHPDGTEVGL